VVAGDLESVVHATQDGPLDHRRARLEVVVDNADDVVSEPGGIDEHGAKGHSLDVSANDQNSFEEPSPAPHTGQNAPDQSSLDGNHEHHEYT